ncbi:hypothetical protein ILYODFUR_035955 [Ilyodon furcidens]|uniref:Cytochrome c biogenesis B n=1 Tax=Ilyodon furcidens TaxID=33524 RepID=A0ABV0TF57_9TELE
MFKFILKRHKLGPTNMPLLSSRKSPYVRFLVSQIFQANLSPMQPAPSQFSGHSFRIGAATTGAVQGLSSASLQQLGCWSSPAFSSYVHPDFNTVLTAPRQFFYYYASAARHSILIGSAAIHASLFMPSRLDISFSQPLRLSFSPSRCPRDTIYNFPSSAFSALIPRAFTVQSTI